MEGRTGGLGRFERWTWGTWGAHGLCARFPCPFLGECESAKLGKCIAKTL